MKYPASTLLFSLFLSACSLGGQYSFEVHYVAMNETIDDEHVNYRDGSLQIDNTVVDIPDGDNLMVNYRCRNGVLRYKVEVDGELVTEVESQLVDLQSAAAC